jgi:hypothetical protein
MIYTDQNGYPVDQTYDGGDSAVRNSILWACGNHKRKGLWTYLNEGFPVRYPVVPPHNNPKNMTRDNLLMLMAAEALMRASPYAFYCKMILYRLLKRLCFCFNSERDYPGTTKYPWPHKMTGGDLKDEGKWRMFDAPDFMFPNHMWVVMCAARVSWRWAFYPICLAFHLLFFVGSFHRQSQRRKSAIHGVPCFQD